MTDKCFLEWCGNSPSDGIFLLSFPKSQDKIAAWCQILNVDFNEIVKREKIKVCSVHFKSGNSKTTTLQNESKTGNNLEKNHEVNNIFNKNETQKTILGNNSNINRKFPQPIINKIKQENSTLYEKAQIVIINDGYGEIEMDPLHGYDPLSIPNNLDEGKSLDHNNDNDDDDDSDGDNDNDNHNDGDNDNDNENDNDNDIFDMKNNDDNDNNEYVELIEIKEESDEEEVVTNTSYDELRLRKCSKAANTPKHMFNSLMYHDNDLKTITRTNALLEKNKEKLKMKSDLLIHYRSKLEELKKKKIRNRRLLDLFKNKSDEMKLPFEIFLNLMKNMDNDNSSSSSSTTTAVATTTTDLPSSSAAAAVETTPTAIPSSSTAITTTTTTDSTAVSEEKTQEVQQSDENEIFKLAKKLYRCSSEAYDLIHKVFINVFPEPQKMKQYDNQFEYEGGDEIITISTAAINENNENGDKMELTEEYEQGILDEFIKI